MNGIRTLAAIAMSTAALMACQGSPEGTSQYDLVMQQVELGQPAATLWVQGMTCPF